MKLMIDQREKKSYQPLLEKEGISCNSTYLKTGDYGIEGHPDFSIERKELSDLAQCCGRSRDRFEKELQRAVELDYFAVIIEGSIQDILKGKYFSKIKPNSVIGSIFAWSVYYKIKNSW